MENITEKIVIFILLTICLENFVVVTCIFFFDLISSLLNAFLLTYIVGLCVYFTKAITARVLIIFDIIPRCVVTITSTWPFDVVAQDPDNDICECDGRLR